MKLIIFTLCILGLSLNSFANLETYFDSAQMNSMCQHAAVFNGGEGSGRDLAKIINASDKYVYMGLSADGDGRVIIKNRSTHEETMIDFDSSVKNIQIQSNEVLITTSDELLVLNKSDNTTLLKIKTLPSHISISKNGTAFGAYKYSGVYYIAHGKLGVIPFDTASMTHLPAIESNIVQRDERMISMVTGIAGVKNKLYLAYDDLTLSRRSKAFEGILIFDLDTMRKIKTVSVKQALEAYYLPSLTIDGDELIVSNFNLNFRHNLKKLMRARYMKPIKRIWKYTKGDLIGKGLIKDLNIYGCFKNKKTKTIHAGWMSLK